MTSEALPPVPILITAYRRYDYLAQVLARIPTDRRLYIAVDGPKMADHCDDVAIVRSLVRAIAERRSNTYLFIREVNIGGAIGIPDSIDWALKDEAAVCLIEEDCIPSGLAFPYLDSILRSVQRIPSVAGATLNNFLAARKGVSFPSPFLSIFPHCWGWLTTRDSWESLRPSREYLEKAISSGIEDRLPRILARTFQGDFRAQQYWSRAFSDLLMGRRYHWDYAYTLRLWDAGSKFIAPPCNLVSNIGIDSRSQNCQSLSPNHLLPIPDLEDNDFARSLFSPVNDLYDYRSFDKPNQALVFTPSASFTSRVKSRALSMLKRR